jgi:hypothetical protein
MRNSSAAFSVYGTNPVKGGASRADYCGKGIPILRRLFKHTGHILASQTLPEAVMRWLFTAF